jgi:enoyl-CoA hydratase
MDSTEAQLRVEIADHIATVILDRPPVNATTHDTFLEVTDVFRRLSEDPEVRVVVLTGNGPHFCAGADLKAGSVRKVVTSSDGEMLSRAGATAITDSGHITRDAVWSILDCSVPVIAAVHGAAIGSGLAFASVCDLVIAADDATFGMTEVNIGMLGGSSFLMRMMNYGRARYMFFTGELVSAAQMLEWGAVLEVTTREQMLPRAYEVAARIASKSPIAMRMAKESLLRCESLHVKDAYRIEQDYTRRLVRFEDSAEAQRAWVEKRTPEFKWR